MKLKKITAKQIASELAKETDRDREKRESLDQAKERILLVIGALASIAEELEAGDDDGRDLAADMARAALEEAKECRQDIYCAM